MKEKVVLAYSGGLDTSYCVKYLSEELGLEVYTALANTGGFTEAELKTVEKKAYALGAKEHVNLDVTEDYYEKCIRYMVFGNVLRNKTYPVSVSSERTFQALAIVNYAKKWEHNISLTGVQEQETIKCVSICVLLFLPRR